MTPEKDWIAIAARCSREEFVARHPHPFLIGEPTVRPPAAPSRTVPIHAPALRLLATLAPDAPSDLVDPPTTRLVVAPVRKVHDVFPEMVTVGRTANNDVVLPDVTVSKFHAWFRNVDAEIEIVDAGSRNGTRVNGRLLRARDALPVAVGATLVFGSVALVLHPPESAWQILGARHAATAMAAG